MASCLFQCNFKNNCIQNITYTWGTPVQNQGLPNSLVACVYSVLSLLLNREHQWTSASVVEAENGPHVISILQGAVKSELYPYLLKSEIPGLPFLKLVCRWEFLSCWVPNLNRGCGLWNLMNSHTQPTVLCEEPLLNTPIYLVSPTVISFQLLPKLYWHWISPWNKLNILNHKNRSVQMFFLLELCTSILHHSN